jgi:hypothetical protein
MFLGTLIDIEELEKNRIRRHIYLARYGKQSMLQWENIEGRVVRQYANALVGLMEEENEASKRAMIDAER